MSTSNAAEQLPRSQHLLRVLWRGKWWILLPAVLLAALALIHAATSSKLYQGHATVLLSRQNLSTALNNGNATQSYQTGEFLQIQMTQAQIAHSPRVAARVIQQLGLREKPDDLLADVTVEPSRGSDFISFSVDDANKARAQRTAVAFAQQYVAYKRELDTQSLEQARQSVVVKLRKLDPKSRSDQKVFADLQSKEQQLRTLAALQSANAAAVRTSDEASTVRPRPRRDTLLGFFLGLILGAIVVLVRDRIDTRIRRPEDFAEALGMPLLGFVGPPPKAKGASASGLVMLDSPNSPASEGFRVLAVGSAYSSVMVAGKVFMITSAIDAEGKSTTIANLAVAMARTGKRVALVDLDLRRPSLARLFLAADGVGVTDVAVGQASVEAARHSVEIVMRGTTTQLARAALDLYPAGRIPPDPGEFVGNEAVHELLSTLREGYDIVLVDAPPVLRVGDPLTLAQFVDGIFVVGRIGVIKRSMANELRRLLGHAAIPAVGVIATGTAKWSDGSSYGYGYGYGYGGGTLYGADAPGRPPDDEVKEVGTGSDGPAEAPILLGESAKVPDRVGDGLHAPTSPPEEPEPEPKRQKLSSMKKADVYKVLNEAYFSDEPHEREVIDNLPILLEGVRVGVDCGASLGQYTRAMARALRGGVVHSVEADPLRFEELARNGQTWSRETGAEIVAHNYAITDTVGTMPFYITNSNISGGLSKHDTASHVDWQEIDVPTTTLDTLFPDDPPGFVKIDVEGAELAVLRGASQIIAQGDTTFLIELHEGWGDGDGSDVLRLMADHGYQRGFLCGQSVFTTNAVLRRRLLALELRSPTQLKRRTRKGAKRVLRAFRVPVRR